MQQYCELVIEGVPVTIKHGDITKEDTDALVNLTNSSLNHKYGVSKAILEAGGAPLQEECRRLGKRTRGDVVVTGAGNIKCKMIVHAIGVNELSKIPNAVKKVLFECDEMLLFSVAFPAIGTGVSGVDPQESLKSILKGIREYLSGIRSSIQRINIITFMPDVYHEYLKVMKDEIEKKISLSLILNGTIVELVKGDITKQSVDCILNLTNSTMTWKIGVSGAILSAAGSWVAYECAQFGPLTTNGVAVTTGGKLPCKHIMHIISPKSVPAFAPLLEKCLMESKAKSFKTIALPAIGTGNIGITPEASIEAILDGLERSLANMNAAEFTKIFIIVYDEHVYSAFVKVFQAKQARLALPKPIPKQPVDLSNVPVSTAPFWSTGISQFQHINKNPVEQNLNKNSAEQKPTLTSPPNDSNVQKSTELQPGNINNKLLLAYLAEPGKWSPMEGQVYKEMELHKDSAEFKSVADGFYKSTTNPPYQISKIKRIQNLSLWQRYGFIKFTIDQKYPAQENEKHLYHGTDYETAVKINMHGFNRSFCGKNATAYGKGTYFATNSSYSCNDKFSVEDDNGEKHVYQAAVITGKWCLSNKSYVEPPPTKEDPKILYNSTVDDVINPKIFVVFNDYCAYPEYLISFTSSNQLK